MTYIISHELSMNPMKCYFIVFGGILVTKTVKMRQQLFLATGFMALDRILSLKANKICK